jgi:hypothetical protein
MVVGRSKRPGTEVRSCPMVDRVRGRPLTLSMEGDHSAPNNVWRDVLLPCADPPPLPLVAPAAVGAEACFASETAFCCVAVGL